jgi:hypothetical protein
MRGILEAREGHWSGLGMQVAVLAEPRRAAAAAQHDESLRYRSADHGTLRPLTSRGESR